MTPKSYLAVSLLLCLAVRSLEARSVDPENEEVKAAAKAPEPSLKDVISGLSDEQMDVITKMKIAKRIRETLKQVKQIDPNIVEKTVQTNFLNTLYSMANASAVGGAQVSRAAGTLIRGLVQDQFSFGSLGAYLPRLIFLDGPTQFIETLRLIRSGQLRVPMDMDSAIDTLINFAQFVRESPTTMYLGTPFLSFFPNIFRGTELLSNEIIYGVFRWFGPLAPSDISSAAVEALWNRWDMRSSTTARSAYHLPTKPVEFE
jgi:hypothetical protein